MIKIRKPGINLGELISTYEGMNKKIHHSENKLTHQRIVFIESQSINGDQETNYCFEFKLLNRKFLMVLDKEQLFEILSDGDEKVHILLTESWFYILRSFVEEKKYITHITLSLHYEYTPQAEYIEHFELQLNMQNDEDVLKWFSKIRPRDVEEM